MILNEMIFEKNKRAGSFSSRKTVEPKRLRLTSGTSLIQSRASAIGERTQFKYAIQPRLQVLPTDRQGLGSATAMKLAGPIGSSQVKLKRRFSRTPRADE